MPHAPIKEGNLYFETYGEGPPLLLICGLGGLGGYWRPQLDAYARRFRLIVPDHRGCGQSTRSETHYTIDLLSRDILDLMDYLGVERAHVLGHSTGGAIGQTLAITTPERVASLVLYATWTRADAFMGRVMKARKTLLECSGADAFIELTPCLIYPDWWLVQYPEKLDAFIRLSRETFPSVTIAASRCQAVIEFDRTVELDRIRAPTLVICAKDDFLTPLYFSEALARQIPGAQLAVLDRGGHCVSQVDPEAFDRPVLDFLLRMA